MDMAGVSRLVLSMSGPGIQAEPDSAKAIKLAAEGNNALCQAP